MEATPWLLHEILNHSLNDDDKLNFLLIWGSNHEPTWEPRNNVLEEPVFRYFACVRREVSIRYK